MRRSPVVKSAEEVAREWVDLSSGLLPKQEADVLAYAEAERKARQERETERQREYDRTFR
jgi:ribonuclease HI